jgi:hypothetical protein
MRERQMPYHSSFAASHLFLTAVNRRIDLNPLSLFDSISPVPIPEIHPIEALNTYYNLFSDELYVSDITLADVAMNGDISLDDWHVYRMSRDLGLFYEWLSTVYPLRSGQDIDYWVLQQGHEFSRDIIMQGLADPGLFNDIAANKLGAKFGIRAYTNCALENRDIISANTNEEKERWHDVCR